MEDLKVIGNRIEYRGYHIATLHEDEVPPSILNAFIFEVNDLYEES